MSKVDELISQLCPNGVRVAILDEICEVANNKRKPVKSSLRVSGSTPYYGANNIQDYVEGFTHDGEYVLIAEDGSASLSNYSVQFATGKFWANNHVHVIKGKDGVNNRFLFHFFGSMNFTPYLTGGTRAKLNKSKLLEIKIPIPPLEVQKEIASILDKFTQLEAELSAELSAELDARRKQYEYYCNQLFVFDESREVKWSKLSDIARVTIGEFVHKNKQNPNGLYPVYNGGRSETGYFDEYNNTGEKIVISARGAYAGFVNRVMKPYWAGNSSYSIDVTDRNKVNWHYVYYYLKSSESKFTEQQQKGGIPAVSKKQVEVFKIPIPPLDEQDRIVSILDKFDNLTNSISEGLPAEINARRRQYEYYRTKLLTFQELSA